MPDPLQVTSRDLDIATRTLWGECRGEPLEGQQAVSWVIRNRAFWPVRAWWGSGVADVCLKPSQFSCWNMSDPNREKILQLEADTQDYQALYQVARSVMAGEIDDPTKGATSYERVGAGAYWAKGREFSVIIGHHAFYSIGPEG